MDCKEAWRSYTRRTRRRNASFGFAPGGNWDREETTKKAPSPLQLIRGMESSSGLEPMLFICADGDGAWAATFPAEPWNWVCLDPQPTFIGESEAWKNK